MFLMQNEIDRTVGNGTLTGAKFGDLQHRIALQAGPRGSDAYMKKMNELNETFRKVKKGEM
jgi:hypothetical protein